MKAKANALPASIADLSPVELTVRISVAEAAARNGVHIDTFKKNFPHLIKRIGKRRLAVTLYDAIVLPPPPNIARGPPVAR
jgi:hypothetical protein